MNSLLIRSLVGAFCAFGCAAFSLAADNTELFSSAEAAKLLGQPVGHTNTIGPEKDDEAPAEATHWSYMASDAVVTVTRLKFASAADAAKFATPEFVKKEIDEDEAKVVAEPGVGDKGFWTVTTGGAGISFLKGASIASVALVGKDIGPPESHKAALKAAALSIAAKL